MKRTTIKAILFAVALGSVVVNAQAFDQSGNSDYYQRNQAMQQGNVYTAVVISVREVKMGSSNTAKMIGGVVGGVGGAALANGRNGYVQTAVGLLGGVVGAFGADAVASSTANEIIVDIGGGNTRVVVQEKGAYAPQPGQRVRVLVTGNETRIVR